MINESNKAPFPDLTTLRYLWHRYYLENHLLNIRTTKPTHYKSKTFWDSRFKPLHVLPCNAFSHQNGFQCLYQYVHSDFSELRHGDTHRSNATVFYVLYRLQNDKFGHQNGIHCLHNYIHSNLLEFRHDNMFIQVMQLCCTDYTITNYMSSPFSAKNLTRSWVMRSWSTGSASQGHNDGILASVWICNFLTVS